jgi:hypothetical protein
MTLSWPPDSKGSRPRSTRKLIVNPLPESVLDVLAADLPGPPLETPDEKAARIAANKAEILSCHPRNAAEAMVAAHTILMKMLVQDFRNRDSSKGNNFPKQLRQFNKQADAMIRKLLHQQSVPLRDRDMALFHALGVVPEMMLDPNDPAQPEEAVSAIIVPLHPAPKMLQ